MENNEKKTITIKQGTGSDALEMKVQVIQEELNKMEQIRRFSPKSWEGKELELLQEARKLIKEEADKARQATAEEIANPDMDSKKEQKAANAWLWWAVGIIAVLFVIIKSLSDSLEKRNKESLQRVFQNNPELVNQVLGETITHHGITIKYPRNWSFETDDISENQFVILGENDNGSVFSVFWTTNKEYPVEDYIDNIITGYSTSPNCSDLEYGAIYDTIVNGMDAVAVDYSCKYQGEMTWAQLIGVENEKYKVVLNSIAHSKSALEKDFNVMKNSISFTDNNRYSNN